MSKPSGRCPGVRDRVAPSPLMRQANMKESDVMATARKASPKVATLTPTLTLRFEQERETTGTIRFRETGVPTGFRGRIGTLYLTKPAHEELGSPAHITVTVTP